MKVDFNFDYVHEQLDITPNEYLLKWLNVHNWHLETKMDFFPENLNEIVLAVEHKDLNVKIVEKTIYVDAFKPEETTLYLWVEIENIEWIKEDIVQVSDVPDYYETWFSKDVGELGLMTRTLIALRNNDINTIGKLCSHRIYEISKLCKLKEKSVLDLTCALEKIGLTAGNGKAEKYGYHK